MNRRIQCIVIMLCCGLMAVAQSMRYATVPNQIQMPSANVTCVMQDSEGYMWYGTEGGGLCRDDGYQVRVFRSDSYHPHQLKSNSVTALAEDREGRIWYGTQEGLFILDKTDGYDIRKIDAAGDGRIHCLCALQNGEVWAAAGHELHRFGANGKLLRTFSLGQQPTSLHASHVTPHVHATSMAEGNNGNIYIASTDTKLYFFNDQQDELTPIPWPYAKNPGFLSVDTVHRCLWFGTWGEGIVQWSDKRADYKRMFVTMGDDGVDGARSKVLGLTFDKANSLLWETTVEDLYAYRIAGQELKPFDLDTLLPKDRKHVGRVATDRQGNVWIPCQTPQLFMLTSADEDTLYRPSVFPPRVTLVSFDGSDHFIDISCENGQLLPQTVKLPKAAIETGENEQNEAPRIRLSLSNFDILHAPRIRYSYRLRSKDEPLEQVKHLVSDKWTNLEPGQNTFMLPPLGTGDYELFVRVADSVGEWSDEMLCATLTHSKGWSSWHWTGFVFTLAVLGALAFYLWRFHRERIARLYNRYVPQAIRTRLQHITQKLFPRQAPTYAPAPSPFNPLLPIDENKRDSDDGKFVAKVQAIVMEHLADSDFSVEQLSRELLISRQQLHRRFLAATGLKPNEYIRNLRLERAAELLRTTPLSIADISTRTGFATPRYFSKCFRDKFGMLPSDFRNTEPS